MAKFTLKSYLNYIICCFSEFFLEVILLSFSIFPLTISLTWSNWFLVISSTLHWYDLAILQLGLLPFWELSKLLLLEGLSLSSDFSLSVEFFEFKLSKFSEKTTFHKKGILHCSLFIRFDSSDGWSTLSPHGVLLRYFDKIGSSDMVIGLFIDNLLRIRKLILFEVDRCHYMKKASFQYY